MKINIIRNPCGCGVIGEAKVEQIDIWGFRSNEGWCSFSDFSPCELEILTNPDGTPWVHPDKQKFKVRDMVKIIDGGAFPERTGLHGNITGLQAEGAMVEFSDGKELWLYKRMLEKIVISTPFRYFNWLEEYPAEFINEPTAQKETKKMSVIQKLKNLTLSKETKILRENGLEDEHNQLTEDASDMMIGELVEERWETRRSEIAKGLLKIKAEECKR